MGRALAEAWPTSRTVFEEVDEALGQRLSRLCFDGPDEALALTENTQPAILATSIAAWRVLRERGILPFATAGHSLGEWSAHVAAGTLSLTDAARTVHARGKFMQEAVAVGQGAMAAVLGLDSAQVEALCRDAAGAEVVEPANYNAPGQLVVAGHRAAVDRLVTLAKAAGASRSILLPVSAPFHCRLMQPAADRLEPLLRAIRFAGPTWPVYVNVNAQPVRDGAAAKVALLQQIAAPVRWQAVIERLVAEGCDHFLEVGPGRILAGLIRRISREARVFSAGDPESVESAVRELQGIAA